MKMIEILDMEKLMEAHDISNVMLDKMLEMDKEYFFAAIATMVDSWFKIHELNSEDAQEMMEQLCLIQKCVHEEMGL